MKDINVVCLVGRACFDASQSFIGDMSKLTVNLAVNTSRKVNGVYEDKANFFEVVIFGKMGESLKPYIVKGTQLAVNGTLNFDSWEKDGVKKDKVYIIADSVQLLGGRKTDATENGENETAPNPLLVKALAPLGEMIKAEELDESGDIKIPF